MENNIKKHVTSSTFEINGRTFVINSFDPMAGNYILAQVVSQILPMGISSAISSEIGGSEMIPVSTDTNAKMMSKKDFIAFQIDVLSTVEELYQSGEKSPVVRENGTYGVADVTMVMLIKLIIASLAFNFKDFFKEIPSLVGFINQGEQTPADM